MDKFEGKFHVSITRQTWGHGESGYILAIFSSHEEEEVKKARDQFFALIEKNTTYMKDGLKSGQT